MWDILGMEKIKIKLILNKYLMDSGEVKEYLGLSRQRLANLKAAGRLVPVKGNLYWREDVEGYDRQRKKRD